MDNMFNDLGSLPGQAQKQLLVALIIDASGSMTVNGNIGRVNEAMREVAPQLAEIEQENNVEILLAPIVFNNDARWVGLAPGNEPARPSNFNWQDVAATGGTDLASAFSLLRQKLTRRENGGWLEGRKGYRPVILLISDGEPNVGCGWERELEELGKRGWFKVAMKYAIAVEGASMPVLEKFTGNPETIYDTNTLRTDLATLVKALVLSVSMAVSDGTANIVDTNIPNANAEDTAQQAIIDKVNQEIGVNNSDDFFS